MDSPSVVVLVHIINMEFSCQSVKVSLLLVSPLLADSFQYHMAIWQQGTAAAIHPFGSGCVELPAALRLSIFYIHEKPPFLLPSHSFLYIPVMGTAFFKLVFQFFPVVLCQFHQIL